MKRYPHPQQCSSSTFRQSKMHKRMDSHLLTSNKNLIIQEQKVKFFFCYNKDNDNEDDVDLKNTIFSCITQLNGTYAIWFLLCLFQYIFFFCYTSCMKWNFLDHWIFNEIFLQHERVLTLHLKAIWI